MFWLLSLKFLAHLSHASQMSNAANNLRAFNACNLNTFFFVKKRKVRKLKNFFLFPREKFFLKEVYHFLSDTGKHHKETFQRRKHFLFKRNEK